MNEKKEEKKCPFFKKKGKLVVCPCPSQEWDQHAPDCWDKALEETMCLLYKKRNGGETL